MGVPEGHSGFSVPEELLDLLEAPAPHDEPGGAGVPEVVESEVTDLGLLVALFKNSFWPGRVARLVRLTETVPDVSKLLGY